MRIPYDTKRFRKDYERLRHSGRHGMEKLDAVVSKLIRKEPLDRKHRDHPLHGMWEGCRDCHIEGDWMLIYALGTEEDGHETITFHATGNHEYLFG